MIWLGITLVGVVLIVLVGKVLFPKEHGRAAQLMATYRRLTPETLAGVADEELIDAVVGNLLAKAEDARRDAYAVIPTLGTERCAVYSLWLLQKELEAGDATVLRQSGQFGFTELAADALDFLELSEAADALREYLQTASDASIGTVKAALADDAVNRRLVALIRAHAEAFCEEGTAENRG